MTPTRPKGATASDPGIIDGLVHVTPPETDADKLHIDPARELARINRLASWLDVKWRIPFTPFRFGVDSIVGLVPVAGDTLALAPSAYMIWKARQLGVPRRHMVRMARNTGVDYAVGLIPVVGDLLDFAFKANVRNARILQDHLEAVGRTPDRIDGGSHIS